MLDPATLLSRAAAALPEGPGELLTWSLVLAFLSVFLAVRTLANAFGPARPQRRLRVRDTRAESAGRSASAPAESGARMRAARRKGTLQSLAWAGALPATFGLVVVASGAAPSWPLVLTAGAVLAAVGGLAPGRWRAWRARRWRQDLRRGFPDALDMMVVCVEAGLGLDAALNRVAVEIAPAHPPLAAELTRIGRELRAGRERGEVLRGFAGRSGLPEIASFATLLIQSETLGTGIARSLRVQAEEMRAARMLRAEEKAHALPVKLSIPLVFCVLPAMIAVVLLPGAIAIVRDILPNLGR